MAEERRIVWILGAGFSKPLGGPTLADLLSLESRLDLLKTHALATKDPGVYWLYHYGRRFSDGWFNTNHPSGERLWEHAEDFLDKVDTAVAQRGPLAERLEAILTGEAPPFELGPADGSRLRLIRDKALRYVAAECGEFLRRAAPDSERWQPHTDWLLGLESSDVVITLNYDRVIEVIDGEIAKENRAGVCNVVRAARDWSVAQRARVLKLHGSVDWRWVGTQEAGSIQKADIDYAERCSVDSLVLATPGPSKHSLVKGRLGHLWKFATEAIRDADCIVFVGYRFPPTDAHARVELLGAISANEKPDLDLHIVLGPEESADVVRLRHMLNAAARRDHRRVAPWEAMHPGNLSYRVVWHPLFSEDFFSLVRRELLVRGIGWGRPYTE